LPPSQLFIFATTTAAQKFIPSRGLSNETPAVLCGPWANVGCISIEGLRKQLRILPTSIHALLSYQCVPWPRYGFWLGYGLYNHVARVAQPGTIDANRRRIAVWAAEGSLLPIAKISGYRLIRTFLGGASATLPENYGRRQRIMSQWLSLVDYFCGADSTPKTREQFQCLWQVTAKVRKFDRAVQEACGCSLAKLESDWKEWAIAAKFGPPVLAPAEIAEIARDEIIPVVRNVNAPIQRRIRAMRILAGSGYSIGADVLLEMFADPHPDLQLEALTALQQLSGRLGTARAGDWQEWISTLPFDESLKGTDFANSTLAAVTG
jgi:hypothetical protein